MTIFGLRIDPVNFCGFYVIGLLVIASIIARRAPVGYEDETGFHYGRKDKR